MDNTCLLFSYLHILLPTLCILSCFNYDSKFKYARCVVLGIALYEVYLFLLSLVLGHVGLLEVRNYRVAFVLGALGFLLAAFWRLPHIWRWCRNLTSIRYRPKLADPIILASLATCGYIVRTKFYTDWLYGTPSYDSLHYHIPRAFIWSWQGNFAPFPANIWQQIGQPAGGASTLVTPVLYGCGWFGASYTTLIISIGAFAAVHLIARTFGLSARASLMAGFVLFGSPTISLRLGDVSTDMAAAFPIIAATALVRSSSNLSRNIFVFSTLFCIGAAIKQYAAFSGVLVGLWLFGPQWRAILTTPQVLRSLIAGGICGLFCIWLSFYPIYQAFGDISGGGFAYKLSNFYKGLPGVWENLGIVVVGWVLEPLQVLPRPLRNSIFVDYNLLNLYRIWGATPDGTLVPELNNERSMCGIFSLLLFPWLILAVKRGYRWVVALAFFAVLTANYGPLIVNTVGARFVILPFAFFSVLWATRAEKSPLLVSVAALAGLLFITTGLPTGYLPHPFFPRVVQGEEINNELSETVGQDSILLFGRSMSMDAKVAGRWGNVRFEYVDCARNQEWRDYLQTLKNRSRWLVVHTPDYGFIPGPEFPSKFGSPCHVEYGQPFKAALSEAGWRFVKPVLGDYGLWTH
jgi:hypothetical protein